MTTWDSTVDFVIAGSGGGGMVAALAAADAGAEALVLEKQELIGGSTCMSGGIVWVPNNPVMRADGVPDSYEDAMAHFEAVVGDVGPCLVVRTSPRLPHGRAGDGRRSSSGAASASSTAPATATTTPTRRAATTSAGHRAGALGRPSARDRGCRSCSRGSRRASDSR